MNSSKNLLGFKISKWINSLKSNNKIKILLLILFFLILFLIVFSSTGLISKDVEGVDNSIDYVTNLEKRLSKTLSKVDGAGKVSVVVSVESGKEIVYASKVTISENNSVKETTSSPILVNGKPVVVKENNPKVIGVLIVAEGADNISVLYKLQQATISLLDININQIEILSMKK